MFSNCRCFLLRKLSKVLLEMVKNEKFFDIRSVFEIVFWNFVFYTACCIALIRCVTLWILKTLDLSNIFSLFCVISCNFFKITSLFVTALGYKNHKSCKILPKFSSALHFSQELYKFVQESQILQICYNVEHFLQDSDNIFAKNAFFW